MKLKGHLSNGHNHDGQPRGRGALRAIAALDARRPRELGARGLLGVTFLNVETVVHDAAVVVAPVGEIDMATVRAFDAELRRAESYGRAVVVVDLRGLEFIGASGLTALWSARERASSRGRRLALARCGRHLMRVLEITGLDRHFEIVTDPADLSDGQTGR